MVVITRKGLLQGRMSFTRKCKVENEMLSLCDLNKGPVQSQIFGKLSLTKYLLSCSANILYAGMLNNSLFA